jgi:hypothetical protein
MLIASARMRNMCFCFHSSTMCCIVQSISVVEAVLYFHYASTVYLRICNLLLVISVSFTVIDAKWWRVLLCAYLRCSKSSGVKDKDILTNLRGEGSWVKRWKEGECLVKASFTFKVQGISNKRKKVKGWKQFREILFWSGCSRGVSSFTR